MTNNEKKAANLSALKSRDDAVFYAMEAAVDALHTAVQAMQHANRLRGYAEGDAATAARVAENTDRAEIDLLKEELSKLQASPTESVSALKSRCTIMEHENEILRAAIRAAFDVAEGGEQ